MQRMAARLLRSSLAVSLQRKWMEGPSVFDDVLGDDGAAGADRQANDEEQLRQQEAVWDAIDKLEQERSAAESKGSGVGVKAVTRASALSYREAVSVFQAENLVEKHNDNLLVELPHMKVWWRRLFAPRLASPKLVEERDFFYALAQEPFDNASLDHDRLLQTLYMRLAGSPVDVPRFGPHWETIGFQGNDPATDLRGVGMLGLVQLLGFLYQDKERLMAIYRTSCDDEIGFPLAVVGMNLTKLTLEAGRVGLLTKQANKRGSFVQAALVFYKGLFAELHHVWRTQRKTIADFGYVLKDLDRLSKHKPKHIFAHVAGWEAATADHTAMTDVEFASSTKKQR